MKFCEKIKKLRIDKKMTQEEVANAIGVSRRMYVTYEKGEAEPRTRITYINLAKVLDCNVDFLLDNEEDNYRYKRNLAVGMSVAGVIPLAFMGIPGLAAALAVLASGGMVTKIPTASQCIEEKDIVENDAEIITARYKALNQEIQKFAAISIGVIYGKLAEQGIRFRPMNNMETDIELYETDTLLSLEGENYSSWLINFVASSETDKEFDNLVKLSATKMFERLFFQKPDPNRKVSIVVNTEELFDYLLAYKGKNSYRGNLSIIQIDVNTISIVREEYISRFDYMLKKVKVVASTLPEEGGKKKKNIIFVSSNPKKESENKKD